MGCKRSYTPPSYVHVHPGYKEKSPDLQGTLKLHLLVKTEYQGRRGPEMKIGMHIILCVHAAWL